VQKYPLFHPAFRECKRKLDFYRLPAVLVLQIKRFSYGKYSKQKLNSRIRVAQKLDLGPLLTHTDHASTKRPIYRLVGMVNHSGDINGGHYTAQCRNPHNARWYNFNDSSVSETSVADTFESSSPYLLFYSREE
jgi:ubiquitin C-terminal hydrolase